MTTTHPPTLTEHERLKRVLGNTRWSGEAVSLARAAFPHLEGRSVDTRQRLHSFLREVAPIEYAACHNLAAAGRILEVLIAEAADG